MTVDVLFYALVAAGLIFWLRSVLGTRHGDERQRPNPFAREAQKPDADASHPTTGILPDDAPIAASGVSNGAVNGGMNNALAGVVIPVGKNLFAAPGAEAGLLAIADADPNFNATHFLEGAQDAFVMIVEAFAANDRTLLKDLLEPSLYAAFDRAMAAREARGETAQTEIHAIRRAEIVEARILDKRELVTVRFVADETATVCDADGQYISGNPDRVKETIDIWTFGKPVKSREPMWQLLATREEDADKKGMPETSI